ncbi:unnamed protein product [Tetraodon nigroviridis]|uniref:(spotted green pufferfish) hypothetical protein n=1 Tax=Tetraodon nigroviridis TaxID=99883 RepID=Q4RXB1_TETNG|nr:unnamed protein product [Tetraodon nigroviridis]
MGRPEATWEDRSVHTVSPSSWTVTDSTPDRITFLAISTPSPPIPATRTLAVPIRRIASWPRTYLQEVEQKGLRVTGLRRPTPATGAPKFLQVLEYVLLEESILQVALDHGGLWRGNGHLDRPADDMHLDTDTDCLRTACLCFWSTPVGGFHSRILPPPLPNQQPCTEHSSQLGFAAEGDLHRMSECNKGCHW